MDWLPEAALAPDQLPEAVQEVGLPEVVQLKVEAVLYATEVGEADKLTTVLGITI